MAISNRIEGLAGGSRGVSSGIAKRAKSNSAAAAKAVAPKKSNKPVEKLERIYLPGQTVGIRSNPVPAKISAKPIAVKNAKGQVIPPRISGAKQTVKINTNPTKTKGIFGPLKKQLDVRSGAASARSQANAKALKGLKPVNTKKR